jgi:Tfp pilus assembly protein PilN
MIDINLVPPHLRKKRKGQFLGKFNLPFEFVIGCCGGLLILLAAVHVLLLMLNVRRLARHKEFQRQWERMRPDKENLDSVIGEMRALQAKYKAIEDIAGKNKLSWSRELNILSDSLPRGVWLKKIAFNDKMLFIEGSAIAKETTEIVSVNRLTSSLSASAEFLEYFTDFELGSIQRRKIKNVEIADFVITMKLK